MSSNYEPTPASQNYQARAQNALQKLKDAEVILRGDALAHDDARPSSSYLKNKETNHEIRKALSEARDTIQYLVTRVDVLANIIDKSSEKNQDVSHSLSTDDEESKNSQADESPTQPTRNRTEMVIEVSMDDEEFTATQSANRINVFEHCSPMTFMRNETMRIYATETENDVSKLISKNSNLSNTSNLSIPESSLEDEVEEDEESTNITTPPQQDKTMLKSNNSSGFDLPSSLENNERIEEIEATEKVNRTEKEGKENRSNEEKGYTKKRVEVDEDSDSDWDFEKYEREQREKRAKKNRREDEDKREGEEEEMREDEGEDEEVDVDADISQSEVMEYVLSQHSQHTQSSQQVEVEVEAKEEEEEEEGEELSDEEGEREEAEASEVGKEEEGEKEEEEEEEYESVPTQVVVEDESNGEGPATQKIKTEEDLVADYPNLSVKEKAAVGKRVKVYWGAMKRFYAGEITRYSKRKNKYRILYDDGKAEYEYFENIIPEEFMGELDKSESETEGETESERDSDTESEEERRSEEERDSEGMGRGEEESEGSVHSSEEDKEKKRKGRRRSARIQRKEKRRKADRNHIKEEESSANKTQLVDEIPNRKKRKRLVQKPTQATQQQHSIKTAEEEEKEKENKNSSKKQIYNSNMFENPDSYKQHKRKTNEPPTSNTKTTKIIETKLENSPKKTIIKTKTSKSPVKKPQSQITPKKTETRHHSQKSQKTEEGILHKLIRTKQLRLGLILPCNGIGSIQAVLEQMGLLPFVVVTYVMEKDAKRRSAGDANYPEDKWNTKHFVTDVKELLANAGLLKHLYQMIKAQGCNFVLAVAGPPCPPFSNAGRALGAEDARSDVFIWVAEIIRLLSWHIKNDKSGKAPEFAYIIENVVPSKNWHHLDFMIQHCHTKPEYIQSGFLSITQRSRLYWINFLLDALPEKLEDRSAEIFACLEPNVESVLMRNGEEVRVKSIKQCPYNITNGDIIGPAVRIKPIIKWAKGYYNFAKICKECRINHTRSCNHALNEPDLRCRITEFSINSGKDPQSMNAVYCKGKIKGTKEIVYYYRGLTPKEKLAYMGLRDMKRGRLSLTEAAESAGDGFDIPTFIFMLTSLIHATKLTPFPQQQPSKEQIDDFAYQFKTEYKEQLAVYFKAVGKLQQPPTHL